MSRPSARRAGGTVETVRRSSDPRIGYGVGLAAPVLLMLGLQRTTGVAGSLLLNLEGPLTLLLGVVVLKEYLGRRSAFGSVLVFGGAALLGLAGSTGRL